MYIILTYDIEVERVSRVLKICRKYLNWVQNSVLEGEMNKAQLKRLKTELERVIDDEKDSVTFYKLRTTQYFEKETLGITKGMEELIL
ncbi:CRISPR-associated endonuclease Cas2 [Candidatus Poribacteria bacterium]|nr:CRISPR-associated endonuclease Cas2 [Candidatus Poribacteria bacterium]